MCISADKKFTDVLKVEHDRIRIRRQKAGLPPGDPDKDSCGLALSGGGVRSATFNLGLLQAMHHYGFLPMVDYLSTVSGGGYIGSSLTWFMSRLDRDFPFLTTCKDDTAARVLAWLRVHSSYLMPGKGLGGAALASAMLLGMFINLLIFVPLFLAGVYFLAYPPLPSPDLSRLIFAAGAILATCWLGAICMVAAGSVLSVFSTVQEEHQKGPCRRPNISCLGEIRRWDLLLIAPLLMVLGDRFDTLQGFLHLKNLQGLFPLLIDAGVLLAAWLLIWFFFSAFATDTCFKSRRLRQVAQGRLLAIALVLIVLGVIPLVHAWLLASFHAWLRWALSSITLSGIVSFVAGWIGHSRSDKTRGWVVWLLRVGLAVLSFGLLLWLYHGALFLHAIGMPTGLCLFILLVTLPLCLWSDVNKVSMHRYYRDRLLEAYMPDFMPDGDTPDYSRSDTCSLKDLPQTSSPYHIINTNMVTVGSDRQKFRARGGENFIFSPCFVGSEATGFAGTQDYESGKFDLATAFAISGAAVDPNTGFTRLRPLAFIMSLLNLRLGYWIRNPGKPRGMAAWFVPHPFWPWYVFLEMFGWGMDEKGEYLHLSDGGHFETLGLYELVRRKCRFIIVVDAGCDPDWAFADLARACERIRVDFCALMEIDTQPLHPNENGYSLRPGIRGRIIYEDGTVSSVLFVKATVFSGLPEDIYGYRQAHSDFPNQTTADQFFDEAQFEAYRELGFGTGRYILETPGLCF